MPGTKRPSTSSLRRFITSRPYVTIADIRRRFGLDDPDAVTHVRRNGSSAYVGLPEREALKLQDLWLRDEIGLELSVEVHAPVVVGIYPMRIARYIIEMANGPAPGHGHAADHGLTNGHRHDHGRANGHDWPSGHDRRHWDPPADRRRAPGSGSQQPPPSITPPHEGTPAPDPLA